MKLKEICLFFTQSFFIRTCEISILKKIHNPQRITNSALHLYIIYMNLFQEEAFENLKLNFIKSKDRVNTRVQDWFFLICFTTNRKYFLFNIVFNQRTLMFR